ncbi:MAG: hypothetical protein HYY25_17185 [Candidatus Wallbacteria bacterium]|nr:hypothetical protein [Candidatus Wallbacteria bacterium]
MLARRSALIGSLVAVSMALAGCGAGDITVLTSQPTTRTTASRQQGTQVRVVRHQRRPPAPGAGSRETGNVPNLGSGPSAPASPPPNVTATRPPTGDLNFDADTQAVLNRYNLVITGRDASPQNVSIVTAAAQLYQPRQHKLLVVIQRDPSKLPVAGVWWSNGYSAQTELYQPQMPHVADHELAHDLTLKVNPAAGQRLGNAIAAQWNNPAVFPSSYARSKVPEAMAEALSSWAEKIARPGQMAFYSPPATVVAELQPLLADGLKNR